MPRNFLLALTRFMFRVSRSILFHFRLTLSSDNGMEELAHSLSPPPPKRLKATSSWGRYRTMSSNIRAV